MNAQIQFPNLSELAAQLAEAKAAERDATTARLAVERQILAHPDVASVLKPEGTTTIDTIKVTTGESRSWDQKALSSIERNVEPMFWPFRVKYEEDRRATRKVEEEMPDLWEALRPALTVKPRKPSVSLVGDAEE